MLQYVPICVFFLCALSSTSAVAQEAEEAPRSGDAEAGREAVDQVRRELAEREPSVSDTSRRALDYFRVHPQVIDELRAAARRRGRRPILAMGYQFNFTDFDRFEGTTGTQVTDEDEAQQNMVHTGNIGLLWDLRQGVFHPSEIDAYGLVAIQRDLLVEVTRTFFLRRQLQLRVMLRPPEDPLAYAALQLRIAEFTAILDTLTGGWFSREITDA